MIAVNEQTRADRSAQANILVMEDEESVAKGLELVLEEEGYADVSGNLINVDITRWVGTTLIDVFESETRKYDIQFPFPSIETSKITLKLPDGATVIEKPSRGELKNDFIDYRRTVDLDGRSIELNRTLTLKVPRIKVADYQVMRQFATEVYDLDTETIVLEM